MHYTKTALHLFILLILSGCTSPININVDPQELDKTLYSLLQESMDDSFKSVKGISMSIISDELDLDWVGCIGSYSKKESDTLHSEQPFRIASVTKTFVATAILLLHERDSLSIEHSIKDYISQEHLIILEEGGYDVGKIKIKHCLNHTSGLFDYAMNDDNYIETVKTNPQKKWTRTEQLKFAIDNGNSYGNPGERYNYSDTGYILLGEIIERITNQNLGQALRALCKFQELGMEMTWLEDIEEAPEDHMPFVHRYFGRIDATNFHPSIDLFGGGGIVSTSKDLTTFFHALFSNKIYTKRTTLDLMLSKPNYSKSYDYKKDKRYKDYRYGLWQINVFNHKVYTHGGLWGTGFFAIPDLNSTIVFNNTVGHNDRMIKKTIALIKNQIEKK